MFAVIYRSYLLPGKDARYQELWHKIAEYFVAERGAIGSALHKTEDGYYLAYSRWPNKSTRDASWPGQADASTELDPEIQATILEIKTCIDQSRKMPEICMTIVDDLLVCGAKNL